MESGYTDDNGVYWPSDEEENSAEADEFIFRIEPSDKAMTITVVHDPSGFRVTRVDE